MVTGVLLNLAPLCRPDAFLSRRSIEFQTTDLPPIDLAVWQGGVLSPESPEALAIAPINPHHRGILPP
jgi:hypothetical protein